jgi:hypothetical protein
LLHHPLGNLHQPCGGERPCAALNATQLKLLARAAGLNALLCRLVGWAPLPAPLLCGTRCILYIHLEQRVHVSCKQQLEAPVNFPRSGATCTTADQNKGRQLQQQCYSFTYPLT